MLLRHYLEERVSKAKLSRRVRVGRRSIHRGVEAGQLERDLEGGGTRYSERPTVEHKLDRYKGIIEARLKEFPRLSAKRLYDEVQAARYAGGYGRVRDYVRSVRPREPEEAVVRFETPAGRQGQVDFATFTLPWGRRHALGDGSDPLAAVVAAVLPPADDGGVDRRAGDRLRAVRGSSAGAVVRPDAGGGAVGPPRGRGRARAERGVPAVRRALVDLKRVWGPTPLATLAPSNPRRLNETHRRASHPDRHPFRNCAIFGCP